MLPVNSRKREKKRLTSCINSKAKHIQILLLPCRNTVLHKFNSSACLPTPNEDRSKGLSTSLPSFGIRRTSSLFTSNQQVQGCCVFDSPTTRELSGIAIEIIDNWTSCTRVTRIHDAVDLAAYPPPWIWEHLIHRRRGYCMAAYPRKTQSYWRRIDIKGDVSGRRIDITVDLTANPPRWIGSGLTSTHDSILQKTD